MRIQHNIMAMSAYRNYTNNVSAMKKNLEKLSSGYKINRAGDDAAGLAISEKMRAQITGLETAQKNAKDGISLVQTAEGALTEVHDMLNRMVELATQSANGTYDDTTDRAQLQKEMDQLRSEINRIADSSNFNGIKLLDGSMSKAGAASALERFELPGLADGQPVGSGTIKHVDAASGSDGTRFSVDLHNVELSNATGNSYTLTAGTGASKLEITFSGTSAASAAVNVTASALCSLLTGSTVAGLQIDSVMVGTVAASISASGVIKTTQFGDIKITKDSKGDDRLTFQQVKRPATQANEWAGAREISITQTKNGGAAAPLIAGPVVLSANTPVLSASGTVVAISGSASTAVTGDITYSDTDLLAALGSNAPASGAGSITLGYANGTWTLTVGSASIKVTASVSASGGTVTFKSSTGADVMTMILDKGSAVASMPTMGAIQNAFGTAKTAGSYSVTEAPGSGSTSRATLAANATLGTIKTTISAELTAGTPSTGSTGQIAQLAIPGFDWAGSTALTATQATSITALGTITIGQGADSFRVSLASVASAGNKASAVLGKILTKIQDAANKAAIDAWNGGASSVTVYEDFHFASASGVTILAAGSAPNLTFKKTVYSKQNNNNNAGTGGAMGRDYNFTATDIKTVKADSGKRLASTYIDRDQLADVVKAGGQIMLGGENNVYTFVKKPTGAANEVDISDLLDDNGNLLEGKLDEALERLTDAADNNTMYTVGYDNGQLGLVEKEVAGDNGVKDGYDLKNFNDIKRSLGFKAPATEGNGGLRLQIGDTADPYNQLTVDIKDMHTWSMGEVDENGDPVGGKSINDISIANQKDAAEAIDIIKSAINYVSDVRGTLGATQNRLDHTINNLSVMTENIQDAESTIRDTDVADEMMAYTKNNILIQSAQAMLAQANQVPQGVLQLLQ